MNAAEDWIEPLPFIVNIEGNLEINLATCERLSKIMKPVTVVAMTGPKRTGKSYLMNRLAGQRKGFSVGPASGSKTKGIWIWSRPNPLNPDSTLLLLDTQDIGDSEKAKEENDLNIYLLAVLLSSTLVFNTTEKFNQEMITRLKFVKELTKRIRVKGRDTENDCAADENRFEEFTKYFPNFVLAVRDFTQELKENDEKSSPTQHLDEMLKLKEETTESDVLYNIPREVIRSAFRNYRCFIFPRPVVDDKQLVQLDEIDEADLTPEFVHHYGIFHDYIIKYSETKKLPCGKSLNGRSFANLAAQYVDQLRTNVIPCIESTCKLVASKENHRLQTECKTVSRILKKIKGYPISEEILFLRLEKLYIHVMNHFRKHAILYEEDWMVSKNVVGAINEIFHEIVEENCPASRQKYLDSILKLWEDITEKIKNGEYNCEGGYTRYADETKVALDSYSPNPLLGTEKEAAMLEFLQRWLSDELSAVLARDKYLSDEEKKIALAEAEERVKAQTVRAQDAEAAAHKRREEFIQKNNEKEITKVYECFKKKLEHQTQEAEDLLNKHTEEQLRLSEEGMKKRALDMEEEIGRLKKALSTPTTCTQSSVMKTVLP